MGPEGTRPNRGGVEPIGAEPKLGGNRRGVGPK